MRHPTTNRPTLISTNTIRRSVVTIAVLALMAGCSSDDDDNASNGGNNGPDSGMAGVVDADLAVAQNDGMNPGNVQFFTGGLSTPPATLGTEANQGITFDAAGVLYQNGDSEMFTGIRALNSALSRVDMDVFNAATDRTIGSTPGKGLAYVAAGDLLVSADVTDAAQDLKIYAATAGMDAEPLFTVDTDASVWDVFYAADSDRLYAALTDGRLAVFDEFSVAPDAAADRTITPVNPDDTQASVNFHGVFVEDDTVLVSDVGSADSPTDGALFTFTDDGTLDGSTMEFTQVAGTLSNLGNPVDAVLTGGSAVVAEKSNDAILVFDAIATLSGDVAPDSSTAFTKPESVELSVPLDAMAVDVNDQDATAAPGRIVVAQNPTPAQEIDADNSAVGRVLLSDTDLADAGAFDAGDVQGLPGAQSFRTLENIQFDPAGNAYAVFDVTDGDSVSGAGLAVLHQLATRADGSFDVNRDRLIMGAESGLTSPKGIEVVASRGMIIVADIGNDATAASLQVYSMAAADSPAPIFTVGDTGSAAIWDIDYDSANDRLYAAGTAGDILVYDNFIASAASASPTRSIQPSTAGATSNMHGIVHVSASDQLIASDVGSAMDATDGSVYVIDVASTATGSVAPSATLSGADTQLGNPVDIAFDGMDLHVAEKSNDQILVFNGILDLSGELTQAADQSTAVIKPESVALMPSTDGSASTGDAPVN